MVVVKAFTFRPQQKQCMIVPRQQDPTVMQMSRSATSPPQCQLLQAAIKGISLRPLHAHGVNKSLLKLQHGRTTMQVACLHDKTSSTDVKRVQRRQYYGNKIGDGGTLVFSTSRCRPAHVLVIEMPGKQFRWKQLVPQTSTLDEVPLLGWRVISGLTLGCTPFVPCSSLHLGTHQALRDSCVSPAQRVPSNRNSSAAYESFQLVRVAHKATSYIARALPFILS